MPDITGWSSSEVITLCKLLNLDYTLNGHGNVVSFSIAPNTEIITNTKIEITLE
jgi:hypothetical protein